jgi:eukaryotic-like serine/threonine-protein kinase
MTCPSCNSPLEPTARFCGVCGHRQAPNRAAPAGSSAPAGAPQAARAPALAAKPSPSAQPRRAASPVFPGGAPALQARPANPDGGKAVLTPPGQKPGPRAAPKPSRPKSGDEIYIDQVLNNRFKVESKIGEGGFGAVYRGVQLATGRKVALKLLHPEMTKDDNLVARFRREGMVLCNLRDAHTITTYDFDQTPDGTLYIAMELLEGKSLHQIFHEEAPLDWKRVFKILTEMCSSLAEAHAQGIVHRDLKPENIYLETRSGNPEFVKILDFGIAKVMRGDTIDPQSPQLTATGQTLGTLEYMSPEQLMGKPLDGRSDVYALGVLAYEMITGRLPFPDAKGPAGLITAQLKQTPAPPSQTSAKLKTPLPKAADRAILKCLEKDKNNRYPDVSALAVALQDVMTGQSSELAALKQMPIPAGQNHGPQSSADMLETRRGDLPNMMPPPMPATPMGQAYGLPGMPPDRASGIAPMGPMGPMGAMGPMGPMGAMGPTAGRGPQHPAVTPPAGSPQISPMASPSPYAAMPQGGQARHGGTPMPMAMPIGTYPQPARPMVGSSKKLLWWVLALLAIGAGVGTVVALLVSK